MPNLDHLLAVGFTAAQDFRSPLSVIRERTPDRQRAPHGTRLLAQLGGLAAEIAQLRESRLVLGVADNQGVAIALEIFPAGSLDPGSVEWKRDGIEVLNVTKSGQGEIITVMVPEGKLAAFQSRVEKYLHEDGPPGKNGAAPRPRHADLINAISGFRRAAFAELWTDVGPLPPDQAHASFTVWLRMGAHTAAEVAAVFRAAAATLGIEVEAGHINFPGRVVVAVHATRDQLEKSLALLDLVAEIRSTSASAAFYISELKPYEQVQWVQDLSAYSGDRDR